MTNYIDEGNLPLKAPGPGAEPRYVESGKGYRAPAGSWATGADIAVIHDRIAGVDGDVEQLGDRVGDLEAGQSAGQLVYHTWVELSAVTGSAGVGAQVIDDTGTHTDPVVGGTVANAGQYVWSESPAGWRWVRPDALPLKADKAAVDDAVDDIKRLTSENPATQGLLEILDPAGFVAARISDDGVETPGVSFKAGGFENSLEEVGSTPRDCITFADRFGFHLAEFGPDAESTLTADGLRNKAFEIKSTPGNDVIFADRFGFHLFSAMAAQQGAGGGGGGGDTLRQAILAELNAAGLAAGAAARDELPTGIQPPVFDYNIVVVYGQSLSTGYETWPAKSKVNQEPNLLMLGESTRPNSRSSSSFVPVGSATLQPLKAVVQATTTGNPVMDDEDVSELPHTNASNNDGEAPEIGAINFWRQLYLQNRWLESDPTRKIVAVNCGVGGQSIERLSKGHPANYYNRIYSAVDKIKTIADGEGKTCGVIAILHIQGEYDYTEQNEGVNNKANFIAKTEKLFEDIIADTCVGLLGQTKRPAIFTYQTGATYARDSQELAIGMAQIEMAKKPGVFLAAPVYPVTDKGGHLCANGSRWLGTQFGKVMHKVLTKGQGWQPLKSVGAKVVGAEVLVSYAVPHPPLQFREAYRGFTAYMPATRGYRVTDEVGEISILSVSIAGPATVSISLSRQPVGQVKVWYAPQTTHQGTGNLCDSDPTVSPFTYEYQSGSGDWDAANIASLIDKPYPLNNFAVAEVIYPE